MKTKKLSEQDLKAVSCDESKWCQDFVVRIQMSVKYYCRHWHLQSILCCIECLNTNRCFSTTLTCLTWCRIVRSLEEWVLLISWHGPINILTDFYLQLRRNSEKNNTLQCNPGHNRWPELIVIVNDTCHVLQTHSSDITQITAHNRDTGWSGETIKCSSTTLRILQ